MEFKLLDTIQSPADLRKLNTASQLQLCEEIRHFLIETIINSGGHFAANLGVIESTVALHYCFNTPHDKLIWDVGHQAYPHKIITGRKNDISNIRNFGGISGFPKISENEFDHFGTGHSSTAISSALGMSVAFKLQNKTNKTIAVVGDAALTAGLSFEALNNVMAMNSNLLIVINDNHIGIDPNTGAIDLHLQNIQSHAENIFTNLGIPYFGPYDGHNLETLIEVFENNKKINTPAIVHIRTVKGKGYLPAEQEQTKWHSTNKYVKISKTKPGKKWQEAFGDCLINILENNPKTIAVTPAMPSGSGMIKAMDLFPNRVFDVGIAEQHAITFAAGMATQNLVPIVNIYSSFLQRAYDQWIHDVALQKLPVVLCIDRAGLVGEDGPTHHGAFDISYLNCIPDTVISAPRNAETLNLLLNTAIDSNRPFCIRYPKGEIPDDVFTPNQNKLEIGKAQYLKKGKDIAIISFGALANELFEKVNSEQLNITWLDLIFVKPLDIEKVTEVLLQHQHIITIEDGSLLGGMNTEIKNLLLDLNIQRNLKCFGLPDEFVTHGNNAELYKMLGVDAGAILECVKGIMN